MWAQVAAKKPGSKHTEGPTNQREQSPANQHAHPPANQSGLLHASGGGHYSASEVQYPVVSTQQRAHSASFGGGNYAASSQHGTLPVLAGTRATGRNRTSLWRPFDQEIKRTQADRRRYSGKCRSGSWGATRPAANPRTSGPLQTRTVFTSVLAAPRAAPLPALLPALLPAPLAAPIAARLEVPLAAPTAAPQAVPLAGALAGVWAVPAHTRLGEAGPIRRR